MPENWEGSANAYSHCQIYCFSIRLRLLRACPKLATDTLPPMAHQCRLRSSHRRLRAKDTLHVSYEHPGRNLDIQFWRTIRAPDNRSEYSLPPGLGTFPISPVGKYEGKLPDDMAVKGGCFYLMYRIYTLSIARRSNSVEIKHSIEREAMWIRFRSRDKPAINVFVGGGNAVSGKPMLGNAAATFGGLNRKSQGKTLQDYLVTPQQLWLDEVASHDGEVRQFVAMSSESRYSVEYQVTGEEVVRPSIRNHPTSSPPPTSISHQILAQLVVNRIMPPTINVSGELQVSSKTSPVCEISVGGANHAFYCIKDPHR